MAHLYENSTSRPRAVIHSRWSADWVTVVLAVVSSNCPGNGRQAFQTRHLACALIDWHREAAKMWHLVTDSFRAVSCSDTFASRGANYYRPSDARMDQQPVRDNE